MKYLGLLLSALILTPSVFAEEDEKIISSRIDKVTVFTQGAQVNRVGSVLIPKGSSYIVFDDVTGSINSQSIQASGKGDFTIMDVQYRYWYPKPEEVDNSLPDHIQKQIDALNDSIRHISIIRSNVQQRRNALNTEHQLILNHPLIKGQGKADSLDLLVGTVKFIQAQLIDIANRQMELQMEDNRLTKRDQSFREKLRTLQNYNSNRPKPKPQQAKHQVLVYVNADRNVNATLSINYAVRNAGWYPWYDVKAKNAGEPIELVYKAAVHQTTGKDWKGVKLTVSNANPLRSATKPMLPVWYINYYTQRVTETSAMAKKRPYLVQREDMADKDEMLLEEKEVSAGAALDYTQRMQNFTSVEFEIDLPSKINANGKAHFVAIAKHELKANFQHYIVPKLDNDAFVVAHIVDWENLDLLPGNANLYFGNTYVGRTVLDPTIVTDTLQLAMGRDQSIAVKRTKLVAETKSKIIGSDKVYTATYQIEIRNNGSSESTITIEDQIPISQNEKIKVELTKDGGATHNERTGMLTWRKKIDPKKTKTLSFTYKVTYPKDQTIAGL